MNDADTCIACAIFAYHAVGAVICSRYATGLDMVSAAIIWSLWPLWCLVMLRRYVSELIKPKPARAEVGFHRF